ncbi:unnamed protein product [Cuscuta campestris]|uniref:Pectinesterase n=1 Tax=Cuscuta campestris TaxID=132261 RepID=A0A484N001_9ASTE|nr:unnamed protein product [Cuscuta campestris]
MSPSAAAAALLLLFNLSCFPKTAPGNPLLAVRHRDTVLETALRTARSDVLRATEWARSFLNDLHELHGGGNNGIAAAMSDCITLYEAAEERLARLDVAPPPPGDYDDHDAVTWLSAALSSHRSCLDGLDEMGSTNYRHKFFRSNLTLSLKQALARYATRGNTNPIRTGVRHKNSASSGESAGLLAEWSASSASIKADLVVAQDGSGDYKTINEAVEALPRITGEKRRVVVYVKGGVYKERVEIGRGFKNVMLVGDGMDKTVITGDRSFHDGATTIGSATFRVLGDGFWARDMTFENTAGPHKNQAVALAVASDRALFYRCSIKGYQDTLMVHSLRQFYRDCHIYGTIDFIFGDAAVVLQNCDIFVNRPMDHQSNLITAQGRDDPNENTGISIVNSRVRPTVEMGLVRGRVKSYLGRPWKKYSRTVVLKTDIDGVIDPKGWMEWSGNFGLSTLYYGEYLNTGAGASTAQRVNWAGFHVLKRAEDASPFSVKNFIQGDSWIPESGVPYGSQI